MNTTITVLFYISAIVHCLTSRVIAPYLQAIFNELAADVPATAAPTLTVAVTEVQAPVKEASATKPPRLARRRKSSARAVA